MGSLGRLCSIALLLFGGAAAAFAQSDRGTLTGTLADPQGAVIPNAKVSLRNPQTGAQYETLTTTTGNFSSAAARRRLRPHGRIPGI